MRRKGFFRRTAAAALCLLLCAAGLPRAASARTLIDTGRAASLTLSYQDGGTGLAGVEFQLYRAADVSETGRFTLTGDFADYSVALENLDSAGWKALAETLAACAARDGITPLRKGTTDAGGALTFDDLTPGLYLVTGDRHTQGGYVYTPEPFLVCLPTADAGDAWVYDVTAEVKYSRVPEGGGDVRLRVIKVWRDGGSEERPDSVVAELLRDGRVYDTVTLSAGNGWSHSWSGLDGGSRWQVAEQTVPEGYTVSVSQEGSTFVVTNTRTDGSDDPDPSDEPTPSDSPDAPIPPDTPDDPGIPQTGQLWWPVPLLAAAGMVLFLIGWVRRKRASDQHEE